MLVRGGNRAAADADRQRGLPVPRMPAQGSRTSFARATSLMTERHSFRRDQAALGGKVSRISMSCADQQLFNAQDGCRLFDVLRP